MGLPGCVGLMPRSYSDDLYEGKQSTHKEVIWTLKCHGCYILLCSVVFLLEAGMVAMSSPFPNLWNRGWHHPAFLPPPLGFQWGSCHGEDHPGAAPDEMCNALEG